MVRTRILAVLAILLFLAASAAPVSAQTYRFQVDRSEAQVTINQDGSATIEYIYSFVNDPSADAIDAVDVGVPTNDYSLSNVRADIDGSPISDISESPYVKPGVALGLGAKSIPPGQRGVVHVVISNVGKMLYKTNKVQNVKEDYASFQFSPNSFGSEYVSGSTDLTVTLHLPTGLTADEPRWFNPQNWPGDAQPTSGFDADGRVFYRWQSASANSSTQYIFGAAFPTRLVPAGALVTEPIISSNFSWDSVCPWVFCFGFAGFFVLIIYFSAKANKQRQLQYLPPKISVEGNGVKRGLTAVEAAILMEQPMDKITTMVLFSVVKKGAVKVESRDPLKVVATQAALPSGALYPYETEFVSAITETDARAQRRLLQDMMVNLVKSVSEKMRGFSRKETLAYYQDIMKRAWAEVEAANTPEMKTQAIDNNLDWTMLDKDFNNHSQTVFGGGPIFVPIWWGNFDPGFGHAAAAPSVHGGPVQVGSAPGSSSLPSLPGANFAASVVGGIQSMSSNVIGNVTNFTSGVTNATNPVPKTTSSSFGGGRGGGGSHCACACACAGCACACAGGGR